MANTTLAGAVFIGVVAAILFVGAFLQGVTGFGFGMVTMALMPFVIGARVSSIVVAFLALTNTGYLTWRLRRSVNWRVLAHLLSGALFGVPIGVYALKTLPDSALKRLIGFAILFYCIYYAWRTFREGRPGRGLPAWTRFPVGIVAGVFGGAVNVGGPPVILYVYSQPWARELIRATLVTYFACVTAMKIALLFAQRMVEPTHGAYLFAVPVIWAGSRCGLWVGGRLKPRHFKTFVLVTLSVLGTLLFVRG